MLGTLAWQEPSLDDVCQSGNMAILLDSVCLVFICFIFLTNDKLATLNVGSMTGRSGEVVHIMARKNLQVLCVQN